MNKRNYQLFLCENRLESGTNKYLLGDVNGDGNINLIDASYVLQSYNGVRDLTSDQIERADVNGSDTVTLVDAFRIMKYYNGAIKSF